MTSPTKMTVGVPPQLSEAVTNAVLEAGTRLAQDTVAAAGHEIVGSVISFTVMVCVQVAELPQTSVAR